MYIYMVYMYMYIYMCVYFPSLQDLDWKHVTEQETG